MVLFLAFRLWWFLGLVLFCFFFFTRFLLAPARYTEVLFVLLTLPSRVTPYMVSFQNYTVIDSMWHHIVFSSWARLPPRIQASWGRELYLNAQHLLRHPPTIKPNSCVLINWLNEASDKILNSKEKPVRNFGDFTVEREEWEALGSLSLLQVPASTASRQHLGPKSFITLKK